MASFLFGGLLKVCTVCKCFQQYFFNYISWRRRCNSSPNSGFLPNSEPLSWHFYLGSWEWRSRSHICFEGGAERRGWIVLRLPETVDGHGGRGMAMDLSCVESGAKLSALFLIFPLCSCSMVYEDISRGCHICTVICIVCGILSYGCLWKAGFLKLWSTLTLTSFVDRPIGRPIGGTISDHWGGYWEVSSGCPEG